MSSYFHGIVVLTIWHLFSSGSLAQYGPSDSRELERMLDSLFTREMEQEHIPGAAFLMVQNGEVFLKKGYGFANLGSGQRVDPDSTVFRIGSITKTFTATALMQLVERGLIGLDQNVNQHLKSIRVPATYAEPVRSAHLLSHTAGFDELSGRLVFSKADLIPLATFLQDRLVRVRPPGDVPAYSTYGIALAGLLVEEITGLSLESYFAQYVWQPLKMHRTNIDVPAGLQHHVAIGYEYRNGINQPQPWEWYHTFPASSINSTATDMARYMLAHLQGGKVDDARILNEQTTQMMQVRQASSHPSINGFGYGFQENTWSGQQTFEHGGDMRGFSSYMVLLPQHDAGIFVVHHHEGTNLRYQIVSAIMERYYAQSGIASEVPGPKNDAAARASLFTGAYRWLTSCQTCPGNNPGVRWEITANHDGTLSMIGRRWIEVEPFLFLSDDGNNRLAFRTDDSGTVKYMFLGNVDAFEKVTP